MVKHFSLWFSFYQFSARVWTLFVSFSLFVSAMFALPAPLIPTVMEWLLILAGSLFFSYASEVLLRLYTCWKVVLVSSWSAGSLYED